MKTINLLFFSSVSLLLATSSCIDDFTVKGNGIEATEGRITPEFNKVKSAGAFDVHITNGDELEVVINAEQNIIPYIETSVSNGTLQIETKGLHHIKNRLPMEVYITTPSLKGIKQSGSGIITTDYFYSNHVDISISGSGFIQTAMDAEKINASISGSGKLELSGLANDAEFNISGSGKIDSYNLALRACDAKISGSGSMWVNAEQNIHATISGSGNVFYYGNPTIETHISGSGNVIHEN
ncbi:MAG: DUF2807 domain-containing protein [Bacteroidetes bacterium]|nr:DUF2807 domain-containing protein [Bacteroidota bacterium]